MMMGKAAQGMEPGKVGYGETWAKAILMGEHSVVYGYPAVAVPIRHLKMRAWAKPVERPLSVAGFTVSDSPVERHLGGMLRALDYCGPLAKAGDRFGGVEQAVSVARQFAGRPDLDFDITTDCSFPAGRGMGSSAASAGAIIRAILDACGVNASREQLMDLTQKAEVVTHGNPSGLDTVTTCSTVPVSFGSDGVRALDVHMDAYLVVADSGIVGSTREAVGIVGRQKLDDGLRVTAIMNRLGDLAARSRTDLVGGAVRRLGGRMNEAHALLSDLKVSHPVVDGLIDVARGAGAVGAKLTGGGLGGCIIALSESKQGASKVRDALLRAGASSAWVHGFGDDTVSGDSAKRYRADAHHPSRSADDLALSSTGTFAAVAE